MGNNPNTGQPDIPLGFGMALAQDMTAMTNFGKLSGQQKTTVIRYVQGGHTGNEAKSRIHSALSALKNNDISALYDFIP